MEHNGGNQNLSSASVNLCRNGCGFYASATYDGMCSICYKDVLKRQQQSPTASPASSPASHSSITEEVKNIGLSSSSSTTSDSSTQTGVSLSEPEAPSIAKTESTSSTNLTAADEKTEEDKKEKEKKSDAESLAAAAAATPEPDDKSDKEKPKKNRCLTCKKKVGLTGFQCRCGGLYCSTHRYSDMHSCTFDYKQHGQAQIRKNNPMIVGEKVQKI